jgi:hypothetical protein
MSQLEHKTRFWSVMNILQQVVATLDHGCTRVPRIDHPMGGLRTITPTSAGWHFASLTHDRLFVSAIASTLPGHQENQRRRPQAERAPHL